jgi:hypothetical protein
MSDLDILADAVRALRESADGTPPDAMQPWARARLLASARRDTRRRGRSVFAVVALAATLIGSTAWGAWTGRLPRWIELVTGRAPPAQPVAASPPSSPETLEGHAQPPPEATPVVPLSPDPATDPPSPDGRAPPAAQPDLASPTLVPHRAAAAHLTPAPAVHDEQELYAAAHRAHFVDRDPAAALQGWDRYLDDYPHGHFAPEAHYNRAISLVRLGRRTEARAALAPFADGTYGGYRQSEARALRDALEPTDAGSPVP